MDLNQWKSFFDDDVCEAWHSEPTAVLKNISVMWFCFKREVQKLNISESFTSTCDKCRQSKTDAVMLVPDSKQTFVEMSSPSQEDHDNDQQSCGKSCDSPEIKKTKDMYSKRRKKLQKKLDDSATPSKSVLVCEINQNVHIKKKDFSQTSFQFCLLSKNENSKKCLSESAPSAKQMKYQKASDNDIDISLVQSTPVLKPQKCLSFRKSSKTRIKKNSHAGKNCTQICATMIHKSEKSEYSDVTKIKNKTELNEVILPDDSDDNNLEMGITNMVSYLNKDIPITEMDPNSYDHISLNSAMIEEDFNLSGNMGLDKENSHELFKDDHKKLEGGDIIQNSLNAFLAEAQGVPEQLEAPPKVLGKKRKQLPGWTCNDCKDFYVKQNLTKEQILLLNKCSRHRGYYKPQEETLPGYWDMDVLTPLAKNEQ